MITSPDPIQSGAVITVTTRSNSTRPNSTQHARAFLYPLTSWVELSWVVNVITAPDPTRFNSSKRQSWPSRKLWCLKKVNKIMKLRKCNYSRILLLLITHHTPHTHTHTHTHIYNIQYIYIISGGFRGRRGRQPPPFQTGGGNHQHGLRPCAVAMQPFVPRRSISLPLLKILDPPLYTIQYNNTIQVLTPSKSHVNQRRGITMTRLAMNM